MDIQTYHILTGDCLAKQLSQIPIKGNVFVCRECLVDGPLEGDNLEQFWTTRAKYILETYNDSTEHYFKKVVTEFEKIITLPDNSEINLWFENDLFCQANMWFILSLLSGSKKQLKVFRIFPVINHQQDLWKGFGMSDAAMLEQALLKRIEFTFHDLLLGNKIWNAFKENDLYELKVLSNSTSECFQFLKEVCQAHIDRFPVNNELGRPEKLVKEILDTTAKEFNIVFMEFSRQAGIYGFSDLQVKNIFDRFTSLSATQPD